MAAPDSPDSDDELSHAMGGLSVTPPAVSDEIYGLDRLFSTIHPNDEEGSGCFRIAVASASFSGKSYLIGCFLRHLKSIGHVNL